MVNAYWRNICKSILLVKRKRGGGGEERRSQTNEGECGTYNREVAYFIYTFVQYWHGSGSDKGAAKMPGWNPASKYDSLTCPESRCPSPVDHKVLCHPQSCCLMPCMANSTCFPCGLLLFPLSHGRGHEPSLWGPILVCMNRLVHTATKALECHQKNLCVLRMATIPLYTSGVEADIICWQTEARSVKGH